MIGRFTRLGMYEDLLKSGDFIKVSCGALLALVGFLGGRLRGRTKLTI
ncbi:hypothetical protein [Desulfobulbus alkaliphilus]|nr:hypothetical protein [Desulfobulbus alkaliphilus]MBM9538713.1 hypothetical protein [Desulfobulbus alkaliphilus]